MLAPRQLPDFRLEVYLARWEFAARHHLTASDAETLTIGELLEFAGGNALEALLQTPLSYTPTWGTLPLLEAIAATYERVDRDHILTFGGAEEAMFWALGEFVGPGEHAVVTVPNYQSMETLTLATGADVDGVPLRATDGWTLDLDELEGLLRPQTRLVAVNFPNNPTGGLPDPQVFAPSSTCATSAGSGCSATRSTAGLNAIRRTRCRRRPISLRARCRSM